MYDILAFLHNFITVLFSISTKRKKKYYGCKLHYLHKAILIISCYNRGQIHACIQLTIVNIEMIFSLEFLMITPYASFYHIKTAVHTSSSLPEIYLWNQTTGSAWLAQGCRWCISDALVRSHLIDVASPIWIMERSELPSWIEFCLISAMKSHCSCKYFCNHDKMFFCMWVYVIQARIKNDRVRRQLYTRGILIWVIYWCWGNYLNQWQENNTSALPYYCCNGLWSEINPKS